MAELPFKRRSKDIFLIIYILEMSSQKLHKILESYVLAQDQKERKEIRDSLVPGSEAYFYLTILHTLSNLQEHPSEPIPDTLTRDIATYSQKFSNDTGDMFQLREKLLRYDRAG